MEIHPEKLFKIWSIYTWNIPSPLFFLSLFKLMNDLSREDEGGVSALVYIALIREFVAMMGMLSPGYR